MKTKAANSNDYQLIIVDMDGTLYFQRAMQLKMFLLLLWHALSNRYGWKDLYIIYVYRNLREHNMNSFEEEQKLYQRTADKTSSNSIYVEELIRHWIYQEPLKYIKKYRDNRLYQWLKGLQSNNKMVAIYSDYPADNKAFRLELINIHCFYGGQPEIKQWKPTSRGIQYIMSCYCIQDPQQVLMIGDRMSKDGESAIMAGIDYYILKKCRLGRIFMKLK